jgi:hypothetical protein
MCGTYKEMNFFNYSNYFFFSFSFFMSFYLYFVIYFNTMSLGKSMEPWCFSLISSNLTFINLVYLWFFLS